MNIPGSPLLHFRLPLMLLCALLLPFAHVSRSADVDALVEALGPRLAHLALTTPEEDWATTTSKEALTEFYGLPWPLPETKMTREQLDKKTREIKRSVPDVPDQEALATLLDEKYPVLKLGDSVEFTVTKAGKERQVKGKVTSIRMARQLAGGGNLDAAVEIDGDSVLKKDELPDYVKARFFADERAQWIAETVPALRARVEAWREDELAKIPQRIENLRESHGFVLSPPDPGVPDREVLTATEADLLLVGLQRWAWAKKSEIYQWRKEREERLEAVRKQEAAEAEEREALGRALSFLAGFWEHSLPGEWQEFFYMRGDTYVVCKEDGTPEGKWYRLTNVKLDGRRLSLTKLREDWSRVSDETLWFSDDMRSYTGGWGLRLPESSERRMIGKRRDDLVERIVTKRREEYQRAVAAQRAHVSSRQAAARAAQGGSLQDQMRSGTVVVPGWARQSRQSMEGFMDAVNEATVGR